mgnify:CR=1 FL=1
MAFLKIEQKKTGQYLRIYESYRNELGKPASRVLYSLGKVEDYTAEQLKRFGDKFYALAGLHPKELFRGDIEEIARYNYGYYQIFRKIFSFYNLDVILERISKKHRLEFDLINAVMLMLVERLNDPCSKRSNYLNQEEYIGINKVELHHLYRALDYLCDYNHLIQQNIYQSGRDLFNQQLDVVFYDVTTFYFESSVEHEGALRQKGFSKDGKIGSTQVLFGLLIDKNKHPIGYKIYRGDTFESHTFSDAVLQLKRSYNIDKIIVVADRGMMNKHNIECTEKENNYEFIIGEKLRMLPAHIQKYLINKNNFTKEWIINQDEIIIPVKYCTIEYEGRIIIGTYSQNRADKDKHEREERIAKGKKLLKTPSLLKNKAHHFFLTETESQKFLLNEERIKKDKLFDGFLAIATNVKHLSVEQVLDNYKQLYQIEHTFRTFKSHLETRPMFHWTDKRIEGHLCLCYIAYTLLHHLQQKLSQANMPLSETQIRKTIDLMQLSLIKNNGNLFFLRAKMKDDMAAIANTLGLKPLPNILSQETLPKYL